MLLKKNELSTRNSEEYLLKVNQLVELKKAYEKRAFDAQGQISDLEKQLRELTDSLVIEVDPDKIEKISKNSRDIRYRIDDLKLLLNADIKRLIKEKVLDLRDKDPVVGLAIKERDAYSDWHTKEIQRIEQEANDKIKELRIAEVNHPCYTASKSMENLLQYTRR